MSHAMATTSPTITIEGKQFGVKKQLFPSWQMTLPATALTLRAFLTLVVEHEVAAFQERQEKRQVILALTASQINEGAAKGKVSMGGIEEAQAEADPVAAVTNAIQAFEDGLYYVFVNNTQQEKLDELTSLRNGDSVMFLRLVALAGG